MKVNTVRYFNSNDVLHPKKETATGKKKKTKKLRKENGNDEHDIDTSEISAYVNKLGLNKWTLSPVNKTEFDGEKEKDDKPKLKKKKKNKPKDIEKKEEVITKKSKPSPDEGKVKKNKFKKTKGQGHDPGLETGRQKQNVPLPKLMVKMMGNKWYEEEGEGDRKETVSSQERISHKEIQQLQSRANGLLEADVEAYKRANKTGSKKSDFEWMDKMMKTGTLPDRMAAYTVRIQDSPVHNLHILQQLISLVKVQGKQQCLMAADTLRDLFLEDLLPPGRKLIAFNNRGPALRSASNKELVHWIFEDRLKLMYSSFIEAVKKMAGDTVEKLRGKGIATLYQLLVSHPEQEETLLQNIVNKLGDPVKKLSSRALYYLNQLLDEHPRMKKVVVEEVERLLFRNNISKRAQYYGICFLNLIDLKDEHASLAHKLITVYIAFFKASVKTGDIDSKIMSGLLTGINHAFPQAEEFGFQFTENLDTLYKIVQLSQFAISIQALSILFQILDVKDNPSGADRFYRVLYEKLNAPEFKTSSHNSQFLNLIFKALKTDNDINRVTGFTKRLLQICQTSPPNLACAILLILSEVAKVHPRCIRASISFGPSEDNAFQQNADSDEEDPEEVETDAEAKKGGKGLDLDKLMRSSNVKLAESQASVQAKNANGKQDVILSLSDSPVILNEVAKTDEKSCANDGTPEPDIKKRLTVYDPHARNPRFCGAELSLAFELISLSHHFHPSVALFAQTLARRKPIKYDGNPLRDFTVSNFLERFSYRNPKPAKGRQYQPKGLRNMPVNSDEYLATEEEQIPIEETFFHRFFRSKKAQKESVVKVKEEEEDVSDLESIGDDEFDALMGNYFKSNGAPTQDSDEESEDTRAVDFASGLSTTKVKGKKRKHEEEESLSDEDDEDDMNEDELDGDEFISMDDVGEDENDDDDFGMFEDDDDEVSPRKSKYRDDDMFAPAEKFADMLEANADEVLAGSHTFINRDRADKKQLKWESDRDRWVKGYPDKKGRTQKNHRGKGGMKKRKKT